MRFIYGKQDMSSRERAQESCFLLTNGLGGYASLSAAYSVTRGDQGILISAEKAPTTRYTLVQRMKEQVIIGHESYSLSTQDFPKDPGRKAEEGYRNLTGFVWEDAPVWLYELRGVSVKRSMAMKPLGNTVTIRYEVENHSGQDCLLQLSPAFHCLQKGQTHVRRKRKQGSWDGKCMSFLGQKVYIVSSLSVTETPQIWEKLYYRHDEPDGRTACGYVMHGLSLQGEVPSGDRKVYEITLSDRPITESGEEIFLAMYRHQDRIKEQTALRDPLARQLAMSADSYVTRRDSTDGQTIVAGYPFFGDWGRDTMIAMVGCVLAVDRLEDARSILKTFLEYEKDGLVPNMFPEGGNAPFYNTVDAALLLINCLWLYYQRAKDEGFLREAYPVMERIISGYRKGTHHGIGMDTDGLIRAGQGLDQVTWMDVRVNGFLPTPRHGKPVEVNAYWYNALRIMGQLAQQFGDVDSAAEYEALAEQVKASFRSAFWREEAGCLKDVISGTEADDQIRCNQIWALTMPYTMLDPMQEESVVDTVYRELYTPCGLRTLAQWDPQFHPYYGGPQEERDLAYHQGTVWVFPLGAFYRAYLKVHGNSPAARSWVRERLSALEPMLREGCIGQLPEIYNGSCPDYSKGCFAQAWSVGEILTVFEALEQPITDYMFDLYGTLVDIRTDEDKDSLWQILTEEYREYGICRKAADAGDPSILRTEYQKLVQEEQSRMLEEARKENSESKIGSDGIEIDLCRVFAKLLSGENASLAAEDPLVWEFGGRFRQLSMEKLSLYPGAKELLCSLRKQGKRTWLLSNAQRVFTEPELKQLGIYDCFDGIYISSDYGFKKPDPRFYGRLLKEQGIDPQRAMMIGNDGTCDIRGARGVGLWTMYLQSETSPKGDRPQADYYGTAPYHTFPSF